MRQRRIKAKIRVACRNFLEGRSDAIETCWALSRLDCRKHLTISEQDLKFVQRVHMNFDTRSMLLNNWHPTVLPEKLKQYEQAEAEARQELTLICERILSANPRRAMTSEAVN